MSNHPFELTTVIYADPTTVEEVRRLRAALPPSGVPVMDAHVTVYGRVFDLDPQVALERLRHICRLHAPMTLRAQGSRGLVRRAWFGGPGPTRTINSSRVSLRHEPIEGGNVPGVSLGLPVTCLPALRDLHLAVYSALADDAMGGAFGAPSTYRPHLTLTQDMARDRLAEAVATIGDVPSWTFEAHEVALMRPRPKASCLSAPRRCSASATQGANLDGRNGVMTSRAHNRDRRERRTAGTQRRGLASRTRRRLDDPARARPGHAPRGTRGRHELP